MLTPPQFDALAQLLRIRDSASKAAALLVLVDGQAQADAARMTGLSPSGVGKVVTRFRRGLALAKACCTAAE